MITDVLADQKKTNIRQSRQTSIIDINVHLVSKNLMQEESFRYSIGREYFGRKKQANNKAKSIIPLAHIPHAVDKLLEMPHSGRAPANIGETLLEIKSVSLCGFSVLIQGFGSKIDILSQFADDCLKDHYVVRINGFQQALSLSRCLSAVLTQILKKPLPKTAASVENLADEIAKHTLASDKNIAYIIDSIDAAPLRAYQPVLATLARSASVFVASADHFRLGLLWDEATFAKFRWVYKDVTTLEDYRREIIGVHNACLPSWCGLGSSQEAASSQTLAVVLRSLTPHHTSLVKLVASMQLASDANNYVKASDLLKQSRKEMLATNHAKLKSLLHELIDHAVIKTRKEADTGNEIFYLSGDRHALERIVSGEALIDKSAVSTKDVDMLVRGG